MLEKSLGLMFLFKQPQNYQGGPMYIYLKVTLDCIPKDLSVKRPGSRPGGILRETVPAVIEKMQKRLMNILTLCKTKPTKPANI